MIEILHAIWRELRNLNRKIDSVLVSDFDYHLPEDLIAQEPLY